MKIKIEIALAISFLSGMLVTILLERWFDFMV